MKNAHFNTFPNILKGLRGTYWFIDIFESAMKVLSTNTGYNIL